MIGSWRSPLRVLADACVRQPLSAPVPDDAAGFAARKGPLRLALRTARRGLQLQASGQRTMLRTRFDPGWKRLLWIHEGMPQVGDALMDLAPRSLLAELGLQVDLYAAAHVATLFEHDAWFTRSLHRPEDVRIENYDAAIVLSHGRKALVLKRARLAELPWMSLQGFYGGPDFHRARFATQRLADLIGIALTPDAFARHSAQKLRVTTQAAAQAAFACPATDRVALALGGVRPERTYHRWPELIALLRAQGRHRFLLVGGDNGRTIADRIHAQVTDPSDPIDLIDLVGRTTLPQAQALLSRSSAVVCADGGLMHLALATDTPVIAMFNSAIDPQWRLPIRMNGVGLASPVREVDGVLPELVAGAVRDAIAATQHRSSARAEGG